MRGPTSSFCKLCKGLHHRLTPWCSSHKRLIQPHFSYSQESLRVEGEAEEGLLGCFQLGPDFPEALRSPRGSSEAPRPPVVRTVSSCEDGIAPSHPPATAPHPGFCQMSGLKGSCSRRKGKRYRIMKVIL